MRLHAEPFEEVRQGKKIIEQRLNDEKRQAIKVGDRIVLSLRPDFVQKIETEVVALLHAPTFDALAATRPQAQFGTEDPRKYYSAEEEQKYGVVGILFKLL